MPTGRAPRHGLALPTASGECSWAYGATNLGETRVPGDDSRRVGPNRRESGMHLVTLDARSACTSIYSREAVAARRCEATQSSENHESHTPTIGQPHRMRVWVNGLYATAGDDSVGANRSRAARAVRGKQSDLRKRFARDLRGHGRFGAPTIARDARGGEA